MTFNFFQNTDTTKGAPGMNRILWAPIDAIASVPTLPATASAAGQTVTSSGDFVFNSGEGWLDLVIDALKGSEMEDKSIGDPSAPGVETAVKGRSLGLSAQLIEQFFQMKGVPGIVLVQDAQCPDGAWWVIGCSCDPAFLTFDFKSGAKGGNEAKGTSFEFKSAQEPYLYTGAIVLLQGLVITIIYNP